MLSQIAIMGIRVYRKYLSPLKGYKCASGLLGGKSTCSVVGLRIFKKTDLIKGIALLNRQFDKCALAALELNARREQGVYKRLAPMGGLRRSQGGFLDCGGCDAPGCDAPSCDLPACELPACELPRFEMPSCEMPSMPKWSACGPSEAPTAGSFFDCLNVASYCDCSGCGNSSSSTGKSDGRAQMAMERKGKRDEDRRARREKKEGSENSDSTDQDGNESESNAEER